MPIRIDDALNSPELRPTALNMPQVRPEAAQAPARALGAVAQSVSEISDTFAKHAQKLQSIDDDRIGTTRLNARNEAFAEYQRKVAAENDPSTFVPKIKQWITNNPIDISGMSLEAGSRLQNQVATYDSQATINAGAYAGKLTVRQRDQAAVTRIKRATANGDYKDFLDAVEGLDVSPEAKQRLTRTYHTEVELNSVVKRINADPEGVIRDLDEKKEDGTFAKYPHIGPQSRHHLSQVSSLAIETKRTRSFDEAVKDIGIGTAENSSIEKLGGHLTDPDRAALAFLNSKEVVAEGGVSSSWKQVQSLHELFFDPNLSAVDYRRSFNNVRSALLFTTPPGMRQEIQQKLEYFSPDKREKGGGSEGMNSAEVLELEATYRLNDYFDLSRRFDPATRGGMNHSDMTFLHRRALVVANIRSGALTSLPAVNQAVDEISEDIRSKAIATQILSSMPGRNPLRPLPNAPLSGMAKRAGDELQSLLSR